jgi:hypothetical protein
MSTPPMTETIDSANAAASTLFLGQNGEFWDFWLIVSVVFAAIAAIAIGVTTTGSIVFHKREAAASEVALERYKLGTSKEIAEANERAANAELQLQRLRAWRMPDGAKFKSALAGIDPPVMVDILYVPECSDCFTLASMVSTLLNDARWRFSFAELKKLQNPSQGWMKDVPAVLQHRANPTGITILTKMPSDPTKMNAARGLMSALGTSVEGLGGGMISNDETLEDGVVRLVIAPKL